ncbi:hypothetical protein PLESTB_001252200 [Pleodorina starrii]|uniref:Uncharacterized protein n=1 Tax=Pleodorina starrii TaxID=330485 RepID=A0A9W6F5X2_9CHLO|nr:hypothetical protein PLESTM_000207700 [Pleodorina starrii]GLC57672.1 hypothetical protein PLESTB_001252200 [Pleodorina starrii]GLC63341.1 hypothetical protein PLESTF_000026000 [Pleodorina starrii]
MQLTNRIHSRALRDVAVRAPRRAAVVVRADGSVQDLIARDRKQPKVNPDLIGDKSSTSKQPVVKSRQQRRSDGRTRSEGTDQSPDRPKRCKEAIDKGLELFKQRQFDQAIALFNLALELPGNGAYRLPGSPREYSCPSDAEEQAALYNMACAYAQLGQSSSCLTCLEAVLDSGFVDYNTMRTDPDLAPVRGAAFDELLGRYDSPLAKLRKMLPGGKDKQVLVSDTNKPWVLW